MKAHKVLKFLQKYNKRFAQIGIVCSFMSLLSLSSVSLEEIKVNLFTNTEQISTLDTEISSVKSTIETTTYNTVEVSNLGNIVDTQTEKINELNDSIKDIQDEIQTLKLEFSKQTIKGLSQENELINREMFVAFAKSYEGKIPYLWGGKPICRGYDGNMFGTEIEPIIEPTNIEEKANKKKVKKKKKKELKTIEDFKYSDYLEYIVYASKRGYSFEDLDSALSLYYSLGYDKTENFLQYLEEIEYDKENINKSFYEFLDIYNKDYTVTTSEEPQSEENADDIKEESTPKLRGLDCSGFVEWVYWSCFDVELNTLSTAKICDIFVQIDKKDLQIGDLGLLFKGGSSSKATNHVGIYAGKDENGKDLWVHCNSSKKNVSIDNFEKFTVFYSLL